MSNLSLKTKKEQNPPERTALTVPSEVTGPGQATSTVSLLSLFVADGRPRPVEDPGACTECPAAEGQAAAPDANMSDFPSGEGGQDSPAARPLQPPRPSNLPSGGE